MSTIIKVNDKVRTTQGAAFNLEDVARAADRRLDEYRAQAERLLADARREADAIRKQAERDGHEAAVAAASRVLDEKVGRQMQTLMPALRESIAAIEQAKGQWLLHWEKSAVHLAAAIAGRVIRREVAQAPEISMALLREALELSVGSPQMAIHLNPADRETLGGQVERLAREFSRLAPAEIVADPAVEPGGCRIETQYGAIDQRFEAQLARIEEELT